MTMLTKVRNLFTRTQRTTFSSGNSQPTGLLYSVTIPGEEPVMVRVKNQVEARAFVRNARGMTRLPAGTTVTRVQ